MFKNRLRMRTFKMCQSIIEREAMAAVVWSVKEKEIIKIKPWYNEGDR